MQGIRRLIGNLPENTGHFPQFGGAGSTCCFSCFLCQRSIALSKAADSFDHDQNCLIEIILLQVPAVSQVESTHADSCFCFVRFQAFTKHRFIRNGNMRIP